MKAMLLGEWTGETVDGWLMSEKFDGIRCIWIGGRLLTREGIEIAAPSWFTDALPNVTLDGELVGRDLEHAVSVLRGGEGWDEIRYMVFDVPSDAPMHERVRELTSLDLPGHCHAVEYRTTDGIDFMEWEDDIFARGGEGVVLRDPSAPYIEGRTKSALKFKRIATDEAKVISRTGAFAVMQMPAGSTFKLRCVACAGETVTYSYQGTTRRGIPRCPAFICVRDYE
jgi:DNA ligase-1